MSEQVFDFSVDLVKKAESVIERLELNKKGDSMLLTYAQLRKVLGYVVAIKNKLSIEQAKNRNFSELPSDIEFEVRFLKTNLLYQAGRIEVNRRYPMKSFIEKSELILMIDSIGNSVKHYELMCKYVEALVAFYKYRSVTLSNS